MVALLVALFQGSSSLGATAEAESPVFGLDLTFGRGVSAGPGFAISGPFALDLTIGRGISTGPGFGTSGSFSLDLRGVTGSSDLLYSGVSPVFSLNLLGASGGLAVSGRVFDATSGQRLSGVQVVIGGQSASSDGGGRYVVNNVPVGDQPGSASKSGYQTWSGTIPVPLGAAVTRDISLRATSAGGGGTPRVVSVAPKYGGRLHFLEGVKRLSVPVPVDFRVTFTANVDWAGHPPQKVRFITPQQTYEVAASGSTASQLLDMTSGFRAGDRLRVVAVSSDGT